MEKKQIEITVSGLNSLKELVDKLPEKTVISLKVEEVMACAKEERK